MIQNFTFPQISIICHNYTLQFEEYNVLNNFIAIILFSSILVLINYFLYSELFIFLYE